MIFGKRIHAFDTATDEELARSPVWVEVEVPGLYSGFLNRKVEQGVFGGKEGVTLNGKTIGGIKYFIEETDHLDIPELWEYSLVSDALMVEGVVDCAGQINFIGFELFTGPGNPIIQQYTSTAISYLASITDRIIEATAASITITLPTASVANLGYTYKIDNSSAGSVFVVGEGGETINGLASQTIPTNSCINVFANGTAWRIS